MRPARILLLSLAAILLAGSSVVVTGLLDDIPVGTGYSAQDLCTRVNVSGDDYTRVRRDYVAPKVEPLPLVWDIEVLEGRWVDVHTGLPLLANHRIAVYREGLGCTVVTGQSAAEKLLEEDFEPVTAPARRDGPWPYGEDRVERHRLLHDQAEVIQRHSDSIFREHSADADEKHHTMALAIAMDGHLVFEHYANGYHREQPQLGWSMTKSVTGLIAGLMITDGLISLDEPVGLAQWEGSAKAGITWRQLLNMAPGLVWNEGYGGESHVTEMLFSQEDQAAWAASLPLEAEPGTVFNYSTGTAGIAMLAMKEKLGGVQPLYDYYQSRLFAPLGIRNGLIEPDAAGTPVGGSRGVLRPVDWLRLGQLVADHGVWRGERLISEKFMDFMVAASPAAEEYGGSIWRQPSDMIPAELRERLPDDLVWFAGHMGQFNVIVPSENLVVLRMGVAFDKPAARAKVFALTADLLEAGGTAVARSKP